MSISPEIIPLPTDIVVLEAGKLLAVKHVKDSAKCGLKEAKDFVDTYCDYVRND